MSGENCLAGLKILDLTQFEAGPVLHRGAGLARRRRRQDRESRLRRSRPASVGRDSPTTTRYYFLQYNANKRSADVNLKDPRGLELVKDLLARPT